MENKTLLKKFFTCFGLSFLFVFIVCFAIQFVLVLRGIAVERNVLIVELLPSVFVMSILFSTCIGLVQFFIAIDAVNTNSKKIILITFFIGLLLMAVNFLLSEIPGNMNSVELTKRIKTISEEKPSDYERILNIYKLELHKRYSLPAGTFIFAFFALTVELLFQRRKITGLIISIISCILYWSLLIGGVALAGKLGRNGVINVWFPTLLFAYLTINFYLVHELFKWHKRNSSTKDENTEYNGDYSI